MTINSETRVAGPFEGNDSTVTFPFAFKVFDSDELLVVRATGATETVLVLGTNYSVALNPDQNASPGGSVTLTAPLASGGLLTLTSDLEYLQPLDLTNQGGFYPRVINNAFDRVTILLQQLKAIANRTLKFPLSDGPVGDLPGRADRAGSVLAFDAATGEPIAGPNIAQLGTVAAGLAAISIVANNIDDVNTVADNLNDVTNFADVYYGPSATDPATRKDDSPLQAGDLYFNTALNELRTYNGAQWRSSVSGTVTVQNLSGNGAETEFLLDYAPASEIITQVYIHGVYQQKNTYELGGPGGATLIFGTAPPSGTDNIEIVVSSLSPSGNERVTVLNFGAKAGDPSNNVSIAIKNALAAHDTVFIPPGDWYGGPASAADEDLVVMMSFGKHVVCDPGARFLFGQTGDTYLPFFAGISSSGWSIINPHFVWTGQIRWSATGDLQYAVPDPISPLVTRLGAPHAYQAYIFNTAILALSSHSIYIENMKIESLDPSKPCLQGISTARTNGGAIIVNGIDLNDTNVGILAQGGDVLRVTRIRQGRSNQDIGIPGHALYSFVTNTFVDDVIDTGEETGAIRHSGMTVSYKGEGIFQLSNMNSKRAFGPVGWATASGKAEKITIDNVIWTDTDSVALEESNVPAIYNAGTPDGNDSTVTFNNVILSTKRDRSLLGGSMKNASGKITLLRQDSVATTKPFLFGRFVNCDLDLKLIQRGTFDAKFLRMQSGGATLQANNTLRVAMEGFIAPPVIDYAESDGRWQANKLVFTLSKVKTDGTANPNRSLGSPDAMMPGTDAFTKGQNFIGLTDTTAMWDRSFAAGVASLNGNFPISAGTYFVDVMITASTGAWRRLYRYLVSSSRPDGVGSYINSAQLIGTVSAIGASFLAADPVVTVSENFNINVTATVTNATALTLPVSVYFSSSKMGH